MHCPIREYASLHNHSHYSIMDAISTPEEMVLAAKQRGLRSIALTDHGVLHGVADFFLASRKHGMRVVYGMEAYLIHDLEDWRKQKDDLDAKKKKGKKKASADSDEGDLDPALAKALRGKGHLVLLATSQEGLDNLYRLSYLAHRDGFYGKPRADKRILAQHSKGLVASTACMGGVISRKCWQWKDGKVDWSEVVREAEEYDAILGRGRFFLELQYNDDPGQRFINDCMIRLHRETGIPLTVTTDSHYVNREDRAAQDFLYMLRSDKTLATRGERWSGPSYGLYIKDHEQMWESFVRNGGDSDLSVVQGAFENTLLIDSMVEDFQLDTSVRLPSLPIEHPMKELAERAVGAMRLRGLEKDERYFNRLFHELRVIRDKGFANYFLITQRIVERAKESMMVGPGRGSAAGSLLCYMLGITDLDPIEHRLYFERFMDPDRSDMPDIDIDFEDPDAVKDLLRQEFGEDNVGCVSNYSTFKTKGLLKDLGRVYGFDHSNINVMNQRIEAEFESLRGPDGMPQEIKLDDALGASPTLRSFLDENPEIGSLFRSLYGRIRHVGRHAAGVVIGDDLPRETPTFTVADKDSDGRIVQVSFTEGNSARNLSAMGLQKFDLLSLSTLKVISHALRLIAKRLGISYEEMRERIRPHNLNLNDPKVLEHVFHSGNFIGIFQYEEDGIRKLTERVKPSGFDDLTAIIAIYRPGTLASDVDEKFVRRKHGLEEVTYDHPILKDILGSTYGLMIYQEQVMGIAHRLGGLTMGDTNKLRKLLSKKKKGDPEFIRLSQLFMQGCASNGLEEGKAKDLWQAIEYNAGYSFNLSHAASYAAIGSQTAWLATYYPAEFFAAVLTHGQRKELQEYVLEIERQGFDVLPVDVNRSGAEHSIEGGAIRLALTSVDGVGASATGKIVAGQPYADLLDFIDRSGATKSSALPLARVGGMRSLDLNVRRTVERLELFYSSPKNKTKKGRDAFLLAYEGLEHTPDYPLHDRVALDYELLGFSLEGSPFEILERREKVARAMRTLGDAAFEDHPTFVASDAQLGIVPVMLKEVKERSQSNGGIMAQLTFMDANKNEFHAACFAGLWGQVKPMAQVTKVYLATFYRKRPAEDPKGMVLGNGRYRISAAEAANILIDVDGISR